LISFTRKIFNLIAPEPKETISSILLTLCEYPIISVPSLSYDIRFYSGTLTLQFDQLGLVKDEDMNLIVSRILTPQMLFDSWEALILENKVLVISSVSAIIPYCCEFLRRLVVPLVVVNTYVPLLTEELLNTIEAPFPYLVGAQSDHVYAHGVDISDTYVVDLDQRRVIPPTAPGNPAKLPNSVKAQVIQEINVIRNFPLGQYVQRPADHKFSIFLNLSVGYCSSSPALQPQMMANEEDSIRDCFVRLNLSLFGARYCDIRAFYRRCDRIYALEGRPAASGFSLPKFQGTDGRNASTGFSQRNGVICGCMQLLNERKDINLLQFLPCWVEVDDIAFSVYQFADEMPLIFLLNKDIIAVSPAPVEPEGHVFDLQITNQITFRFAATDIESRREWIHHIDKISNQTLQVSSTSPSIQPLLVSVELESNHSSIIEEEIQSLSNFRVKVAQTQMISYFKSKSEFQEFESILSKESLSTHDLTTYTSGTPIAICAPPLSKSNSENNLSELNGDRRAKTPPLTEYGTGTTHCLSPSRIKNSNSDNDRFTPGEVILNLKQLWGIFITGETQQTNLHPQDLKSNQTLSNKWLDVPLESSDSFLCIAPRDFSALEALHEKYLQYDNAEKSTNIKRESSWAKNFFRSSPEVVFPFS
jgi:hypothetical protein